MSDTTTPSDPAFDADANAEPIVGLVADYDELSPRIKLGVLLILVVAIAVLLGIFHTAFFHWFEIHTGTVNETGPYYGFWSGFGSDIGEATLIVGVWAAWRHHNCHVKGCARLGRPVEGTPYVACPRHHPAHQGSKRSVTSATINEAHRQARAPQ